MTTDNQDQIQQLTQQLAEKDKEMHRLKDRLEDYGQIQINQAQQLAESAAREAGLREALGKIKGKVHPWLGPTHREIHPIIEEALANPSPAAAELLRDRLNLEWLMRNINGRALREIGVLYAANCTSEDVSAAREASDAVRKEPA